MNMNWVSELLDLYESNRHLVGEIKPGRFGEKVILLPPLHTTVKAQITVRISPEGDFIGALKVDKNEALTVIPVTDKSASRTANPAPHPLCDNLAYIAGNYNDYAPKPDNKADEKHRLYLEGIRAWAQSPYSHEKVRAVYRYVLHEHTIEDIISSPDVLTVDGDGKIADIKQISCVRFSVEGEQSEKLSPRECWLDNTLWDAYIEYMKSTLGNSGLSYLTGEVVPISYLQPRKIRNEGDGAKLISANDSSGYTYRGRFATKEEAFAIGYEESQKIHNALKWIIRRQGKNYGGLTVVVWESNLTSVPDFDLSADEICDDDFFLSESDEEKKEPDATQAARFLSAIDGYRKKTSYDSNVMLMALNAATTGRLSVVETSSLPTSVYLDNVEKWHHDCGLVHISRAKDKHRYYGMVSIKDIADMLYNDDKLLPTVCNRLRPCVIFGRPLPVDMVNLAVHKASSPVSFEYDIEWERMLSLASSMVKKKRIEQGEKWTMALNRDSKDRSYLFGRLLAVADRIEYRTYDEGSRQTNAKRYMNMFSQRPSRTWRMIAERIEPYKQKLSTGEMLYYEHLIEEICQNFAEDGFADNSPLDGLYLLGYYHQSYELRNKNDKKGDEVNGNK